MRAVFKLSKASGAGRGTRLINFNIRPQGLVVGDKNVFLHAGASYGQAVGIKVVKGKKAPDPFVFVFLSRASHWHSGESRGGIFILCQMSRLDPVCI